MYIEKEFLLKKIDEYCLYNNIKLTFDEKYKLSSEVSMKLDEERVLTYDEFMELLDHNIELDNIQTLEFNDEIVSIEEMGEIDMIDFDISGNKLFYINDVLTHNSAVGKDASEVDNSAISDSMGTSMTADFMLFLLQNEEMKLNKQMVLKCTKNRYTGRTDTWMMGVDYSHMRFNDVILESAANYIEDMKASGRDDDFSFMPTEVVSDKTLQNAEVFANAEVKEIQKDDYNNLKEKDDISKDPLKDELQDIFAQLLK